MVLPGDELLVFVVGKQSLEFFDFGDFLVEEEVLEEILLNQLYVPFAQENDENNVGEEEGEDRGKDVDIEEYEDLVARHGLEGSELLPDAFVIVQNGLVGKRDVFEDVEGVEREVRFRSLVNEIGEGNRGKALQIPVQLKEELLQSLFSQRLFIDFGYHCLQIDFRKVIFHHRVIAHRHVHPLESHLQLLLQLSDMLIAGDLHESLFVELVRVDIVVFQVEVLQKNLITEDIHETLESHQVCAEAEFAGLDVDEGAILINSHSEEDEVEDDSETVYDQTQYQELAERSVNVVGLHFIALVDFLGVSILHPD